MDIKKWLFENNGKGLKLGGGLMALILIILGIGSSYVSDYVATKDYVDSRIDERISDYIQVGVQMIPVSNIDMKDKYNISNMPEINDLDNIVDLTTLKMNLTANTSHVLFDTGGYSWCIGNCV